MSVITISSLKEQASEVALIASVDAQLQSRAIKTTKNGKPYCDLVFADSTGSLNLKVWSDTPLHTEAESLAMHTIVRLDGEWTQNQFGVNGSGVSWARLDDSAIADFLAGAPEIRKKQEHDYETIQKFCNELEDPRLHRLSAYFLEEMGARFRRTAAAKKNHHARRGGLVEHVAQMMRTTAAVSDIYPELNKDLMITGVLFHDCGKLWENSYPEDGFGQIHSKYGEMLGHIPLGIELVNKLWQELSKEDDFSGKDQVTPTAEDVRLHLLHLIGSHHGQLEFGSPVLPRTPEAYALHYVDNLDAKMEMLRDAYPQANQVAPDIYDRVFPLAANLVAPLAHFEKSSPQ